jgi:transposase
MTRLYGRAKLGERCRTRVPFGHWQTATFIAALRHDRISAPWLIDGPMDGATFLIYLERVLCPELQPDDLVVCDNLSSHKVCGVAEAIAACGAHLQYLPAYSPDLNPIEMAFSKLKAALRKAKERTVQGLRAAVFAALEAFTPEECANFLQADGYGATPLQKPL